MEIKLEAKPPIPEAVSKLSTGMMGGRGMMGGSGVHGPECAGCAKPIRERFLLKALDQLWHEDCLKCACCDCRLGEVGSTLFTKANLILCKRDYLRLFGTTGLCSACNKTIPAFEMVMRARGNVYHLDCFACQQCNHRFCVGDKFYLFDNRILCEYDHEERLLFHSSQGGGNTPSQHQGPRTPSSSGSNPERGPPSSHLQNHPSQNQPNSTIGGGGSAGPPPPPQHRGQYQHQQQHQHSHHHPCSSSILGPSGSLGTLPFQGGPHQGYSNSLEQLKRATENLTPVHPGVGAAGVLGPPGQGGPGGGGPVHDDASSGYGSPDSFLSDGK